MPWPQIMREWSRDHPDREPAKLKSFQANYYQAKRHLKWTLETVEESEAETGHLEGATRDFSVVERPHPEGHVSAPRRQSIKLEWGGIRWAIREQVSAGAALARVVCTSVKMVAG